jgi:hypothetical protein
MISTFLDFVVDFTFCILYLVELQISIGKNHVIHNLPALAGVPPWLRIFRTDVLFNFAVTFSLWNMISFAVRISYVNSYIFLLLSSQAIKAKPFLLG